MDYHTCHFCGTEVKGGKERDGSSHKLSDCRPDLVQHESGELCTWHNLRSVGPDCYAYQNPDTKEWGTEHVHFYPDGDM